MSAHDDLEDVLGGEAFAGPREPATEPVDLLVAAPRRRGESLEVTAEPLDLFFPLGDGGPRGAKRLTALRALVLQLLVVRPGRSAEPLDLASQLADQPIALRDGRLGGDKVLTAARVLMP